jgi:hypothetical protein
LGSKPDASSLRKTAWAETRSVVIAIASRRWPFAAARVKDGPEGCAKSALPEITALSAPTPEISSVLTLSPCFAQRPSSSAT